MRKWFPTSRLTQLTQLTHLRILLNKNHYAHKKLQHFEITVIKDHIATPATISKITLYFESQRETITHYSGHTLGH